jgi:hypothetical protein
MRVTISQGKNMRILRFRLTGEAGPVDTLMALARGLEDVDRMEEVADAAPHMDEDSSSAGLPDDTARADFHDIELHALSAGAADEARRRIQMLARELGVVVEWLERF